jgi:hypothetical protein
MATLHVNAASLNLRSEPILKPSTIRTSLPFGHPVDVTGDAVKPGWKTVTATYQGINFSGVVSGGLLRQPVSASKEKLLASGAVEWDRFKRGAGKETLNPFFKFVGEMWRNLDEDLDGKDTGTPWSAACISFIVKNAGYTRFKADQAHSVYINDGIKARIANNGNRDFWGFRLSEHKPQIGDLVCRKRSSAAITYDFAAANAKFESHTDIVVAVGADFVDAVGGNVRNSVSITRYKLRGNGHLNADGGRVFAILRNNN